MRAGRWMKGGMAVLVTATALAATSGIAAAEEPRRDLSFGSGGTALVKGVEQAADGGGIDFTIRRVPGGKIVVGSEASVFRLLPDGRLDPGFGKDGRIAVVAPPGYELEPAALTTDSRGRILVAGTSSADGAVATPGPPDMPGPQPTWATVIRYLPDGRPDPSFGANGRVNSTLGQAPPVAEPGHGGFVYPSPALHINDIAVDAEDRPLLAGSSVVQVVRYCYPVPPGYLSGTLVVRLGLGGELDPTFATSPGLGGAAYSLLPREAGQLLVQSGPGSDGVCRREIEPRSGLSVLAANGTPDPGFGVSRVLIPGLPELAADRHGRTLLLTKKGVQRLGRNGNFDTGFGHGGVSPFRSSAESSGGIAVDSRGRIWVGRVTGGFEQATDFLLTRLSPQGDLNRRIGRRGWLRAELGPRWSASGAAVLIDGDHRVLVGGPTWRNEPEAGKFGFALVRYLAG